MRTPYLVAVAALALISVGGLGATAWAHEVRGVASCGLGLGVAIVALFRDSLRARDEGFGAGLCRGYEKGWDAARGSIERGRR